MSRKDERYAHNFRTFLTSTILLAQRCTNCYRNRKTGGGKFLLPRHPDALQYAPALSRGDGLWPHFFVLPLRPWPRLLFRMLLPCCPLLLRGPTSSTSLLMTQLAPFNFGSVNFRIADVGGAFSNWSHCVPRVSDTLGFEVQDVHVLCQGGGLGHDGLGGIVWPLGFRNSAPRLSACPTHSVPRRQHPCPSISATCDRTPTRCCSARVGPGQGVHGMRCALDPAGPADQP